MEPLGNHISAIIRSALAEDVGPGDVTTESIFRDASIARGTFTAKEEGVIAGLAIAAGVFAETDGTCVFRTMTQDGSHAGRGAVLATVEGSTRSILTAERTALNFLQRMSGIATTTKRFVDAVAGTRCVILDTRKTAPGLRALDKLAVRTGGGENHRLGLYDMVLIKDNHINAAGSLASAVKMVRGGSHAGLSLEVECRTLDDVSEACSLKVDRIMLDNMTLEMIREAVRLVDGSVPLEVSGNVSLDNVRAYAETGVSYVSIGALTHSVAALDISMTLSRT